MHYTTQDFTSHDRTHFCPNKQEIVSAGHVLQVYEYRGRIPAKKKQAVKVPARFRL